MDIALQLAEHVTVLHYGRVIADGLRDEVTAEPAGAGDLPGCLRWTCDVHTYYGESHVLQGVSLPVRARRGAWPSSGATAWARPR